MWEKEGRQEEGMKHKGKKDKWECSGGMKEKRKGTGLETKGRKQYEKEIEEE